MVMADKSKVLTWTELRVGLVMIASIAILAFTVLYIGGGGGSPFSRRYVVKALMSDVNGLKPGAPVRVGGVEVGGVTRVSFAGEGAPGLVEVEMRLDSRVKGRVTTESQATLGSLGLLGEKAVDITTSSRGTPVEDGGLVRAAAEDPFKGLLSDASESTAHLRRILARMDAGEGLIGKALREEELYTRMLDVSRRLQVVMEKLESSEGPLGRLVNDRDMASSLSASAKGIEAIVSRAQEGQGTLGALSRDEALSKDLRGVAGNINDITGRLRRGEGTVGKVLQDDALFRKVDSVSTRLDALLERLEKGDGTVGRLVQDPELYDNLNATLKEARRLVEDVRKDPRKYLRVKVSLF
jgi:phospholipid/cholesterol/gamma-HCH transport system substrate-binding protein